LFGNSIASGRNSRKKKYETTSAQWTAKQIQDWRWNKKVLWYHDESFNPSPDTFQQVAEFQWDSTEEEWKRSKGGPRNENIQKILGGGKFIDRTVDKQKPLLEYWEFNWGRF